MKILAIRMANPPLYLLPYPPPTNKTSVPYNTVTRTYVRMETTCKPVTVFIPNLPPSCALYGPLSSPMCNLVSGAIFLSFSEKMPWGRGCPNEEIHTVKYSLFTL